MFARVNFQTQVTSIMEILCRTAAEEIGKLLDDRCAVLHVELRRYQDENEALKMKVRAMARELHAADESGSCHSGNAREKEERNSLFSEGVDTIDAPKERDALGQESKDIDEESPESLFIKEEHPEEENSDPQGGLKTIEDSAAVSPGKNPLQPGPAAPSQHEACEEEHSMQVMSAANQEHNLTQDWSGCNDVEPRGRKLVAKTEQKEEIIVRRRSRFRVKPSISPGFASIKDSIKEKAWPLCTETDCEGEADEPDKCFAVGQYSHTFTEDQDSTKRAGSRSTLTSQEYCDVKTDVDTLNSDAVNEPGRLNAETQHSTKREDLSMQSRQRTDSAAEAERCGPQGASCTARGAPRGLRALVENRCVAGRRWKHPGRSVCHPEGVLLGLPVGGFLKVGGTDPGWTQKYEKGFYVAVHAPHFPRPRRGTSYI
ncbi:uncharacterized protein LOC108937833 [Arapaima gigas]